MPPIFLRAWHRDLRSAPHHILHSMPDDAGGARRRGMAHWRWHVSGGEGIAGAISVACHGGKPGDRLTRKKEGVRSVVELGVVACGVGVQQWMSTKPCLGHWAFAGGRL